MEETQSPGRRIQWIYILGAYVTALSIYVATLFPGVGGAVNHGDSAKFQFLGTVGGVSHPPGNPLYLVVLWLAEHACWFAKPWLVANILSAVLGAAAVALIFDGVRRAVGFLAGVFSATALGTGPLFWTLSTEAEVYSLNAALLALCVWGSIQWRLTLLPKYLALGLGAFVLCFANHVTVVAAMPAFVLYAWSVHRERGIPKVLWVVGLAGSAVVLVLYVYPPLRAKSATYTELNAAFSLRQLLDYYQAKQFQGAMTVPTGDALFATRFPEVARRLQEQWLWPALIVIGAGILRAWRGFSGLVIFAIGGVVGFVAFACLYDIPDPEGFYVPIVTLLAPFLGFAVGRVESNDGVGRNVLVVGAMTALLFVPLASHVEARRRAKGFEIVETMGSDPPILWDLPDLIERIPASASFALPCSHYGCVEVFNYFRFADPRARQKAIRFVAIQGSAAYLLPSPPVVLSPADAKMVAICSISERDMQGFVAAGARIQRIERPARVVGGTSYAGVPIFCSDPVP